MTDKLRAAAQAAYDYIISEGKVYPAHLEQALEAALAEPEPEQEPVGKFSKFSDGVWKEVTASSPGIFLYTAPPRREWVGLTGADFEKEKFVNNNFLAGASFAAAKLKEKNCG